MLPPATTLHAGHCRHQYRHLPSPLRGIGSAERCVPVESRSCTHTEDVVLRVILIRWRPATDDVLHGEGSSKLCKYAIVRHQHLCSCSVPVCSIVEDAEFGVILVRGESLPPFAPPNIQWVIITPPTAVFVIHSINDKILTATLQRCNA